MKPNRIWTIAGAVVLCMAWAAQGEVKTVVEHNQAGTAQFSFAHIPAPSKTDAATQAKFTVLNGSRDTNGAELDALHDGQLPSEEDQPDHNFFFDAGTEGGWLAVDLGSAIDVQQINTYSWHAGPRGPQVYKLFAADGAGDKFSATPASGDDLEKAGWKLLAKVDTREQGGEPGGQYGVSISDSGGSLGKFRYLLFDVARTESDDTFGNTFFSEIDVITDAAQLGKPNQPAAGPKGDGKIELVMDYSDMPELENWVKGKLEPALNAWYPKIVEMLPSEGYSAPRRYTVTISKSMRGVAATGGTDIHCAGAWFKDNLDGEAVGAVVHELVHVAQQYHSRRNPSWLVEGVADYIRWFKFEPVAARPHPNPDRAKYTDSYRTTGAFLEYVTTYHDHELVVKMNAAMRQGRYTPELWKEYTGKTVDELWELYIKALRAGTATPSATADKTTLVPAIEATAALALAADPSPSASTSKPGDAAAPNTLTEKEKKAGWKLLFDGKTLNGWHNFKKEGVRPGWQVKDGTLSCVDPKNAGDIVTTDKVDWFELTLEYNISEGGNSGIIFHVTDEEGAVWATGPEIQLQDNEHAHDPQLCGWLYDLYKPANDPKTGKPIDATKHFGQWNQVRIIIAPDKCEHFVNGVKYLEYVLGSEDFAKHLAKSKFADMKRFAKSDIGYLALQGDHGQVSFRNIKIRPIEKKKST